MADKKRYMQHDLNMKGAVTVSVYTTKVVPWSNKMYLFLTVLGVLSILVSMHIITNTDIQFRLGNSRPLNSERSLTTSKFTKSRIPNPRKTYQNVSHAKLNTTKIQKTPKLSQMAKRRQQNQNIIEKLRRKNPPRRQAKKSSNILTKPKSTKSSLRSRPATKLSKTHIKPKITKSSPRAHQTKLSNIDVTFKPDLALPTSSAFSRVILKTHNYHMCDILEITIEARDVKNKPKRYGGDYLWMWIYNHKLRASAAADEIIDHKNGTYTAKFTLHWSGKVDIAVSLVQSSEAVSVLTRIRDSYPARCSYQGKFQKPGTIRLTSCHMTPKMYIPTSAASAHTTFCNFTDNKTGFPWFCVKPKDIGCDGYVSHRVAPDFGTLIRKVMLSNIETKLFKHPARVSSTIHSVVVNATDRKTTSICQTNKLPQCTTGIKPRPSHRSAGFYFQDQWNSLTCQKWTFTIPGIRKCFQNKRLHFWGDSTLRQWYEYFAAIMKTTLKQKNGKSKSFGPHVAFDKEYNITFYYRHHGYPIRNTWTSVSEIRYVPNMIDEIPRGGDEVVLLSLWAHFTATGINYYRQRWHSIRESIARLRKRNPKTRIIIKSANTREPQPVDYVSWYAGELDKVMRNIMSGVDGVTIIDVWDMTMGHRTGFRVHPLREVISQEIDMLLSHLCTDN